MNYPRFPKDLEAVGYETRYYYAGDINFGNFRSYVTMSFQGMVTEDDFSGEAIANRFKWGVHDEYMFERLYEDICQAKEPFMYMAFNMSSHEPFTVPGEVKFPGNDTEHLFMNAIYYSDRCLGDFIRKCKESGIWDNTLFILMADHGTRHIKHVDPNMPEAYHIPLILAGGVVQAHDTVVSTIGSQTDMVATVLAQLGLDPSGYKYSRNLLAPQAYPFAFYSYPNAAAVVSEAGVSGGRGKHHESAKQAICCRRYVEPEQRAFAGLFTGNHDCIKVTEVRHDGKTTLRHDDDNHLKYSCVFGLYIPFCSRINSGSPPVYLRFNFGWDWWRKGGVWAEKLKCCLI